MDSSQTSPMRSFPKKCFPASILNLNYFFFLLFVIYWQWYSPFLKILIWPPIISDMFSWWGEQPRLLLLLLLHHPEHHDGWLRDPRTNLSMVQTRVTWSCKLTKGMTDNRKCSDFNMLLQFVNLESIKELIDAIESYGMSTRGSRSNFEERNPVVTLTS